MKKPLLIISTLFIGSTAWAADWTPYLKSLQNNCTVTDNFRNILYKRKAMPKALKGDMISHRISEAECDDCSNSITVKLKNAKAFGHRLKAIEYAGLNYDFINLYFYGDKFMQLMPTFTLSFKDVTIQPNQKVAYSVIKDAEGDKILNYKKVTYPKDLHWNKDFNQYWSSSFDSLHTLTDKSFYLSTPAGWAYTYHGDWGLTLASLHFDKKDKYINCTN